MLDLIERILTSPAYSFGFIAGILLLAFWLVHWITKKMMFLCIFYHNIGFGSRCLCIKFTIA